MAAPVTVVCPQCKTRLRVNPDQLVGERPRLRCATCQTVFVIRRGPPPAPPPAGEATAPPPGSHPGAAPVAGRSPDAPSGSTPQGSTLQGQLTMSLPAAGETPPVASPQTPAPRPTGARPQVDQIDQIGAQATVRPGPARPAAARPAAALPEPGSVLGSLPSLATGGPQDDRQRLPVFGPGAIVAGRYRIVRFIARGGVGEVYEAEDGELRQHVALKSIRADAADGPHALERFRREIMLARAVTHPNVCRIFDIGHHITPGFASTTGEERISFLTMELLPGETLTERIRRQGPLTPPEALPVILQMAEALGAAHRAGVVHRDFKGGNVVLCRDDEADRAVVTDFGLARGLAAGVSSGVTVSKEGDIVGTPAYMAPEQIQAGAITPATDIYALGIVIFEMLTGQLPFVGDTALSTAVKRLTDPPTPPRVYLPDLDPRWEAAILRCLERDPARRFQSTRQLSEALTSPPTKTLPIAEPAPPQPVTEAALPRPRRAASGAVAVGTGRTTPVATPAQLAARRQWRLLALLGVLLAVAAVVQLRQRVPWVRALLGGGERHSVAVLGFRNSSGDPANAWLSTAVAEMLTTELAAGERIRTVSGENVARARIELGLDNFDGLGADTLAADTLAKVHQNLGTDYIVLGSYTVTGKGSDGQLRLDLKLQDTRRGETVKGVVQQGTSAQLFDLVSGAGKALRKELGLGGLSAAEAGAVADVLPDDPEAARFYAEGLTKLHEFDPLAARDLLQKAAALAPNNALVHGSLAAAWSSLGYAAKAQDEAKRALDLSASLPREERLAIEGRYHETRDEWDQAAEIYRQLFDLFPDTLDYGLRLSRAATSAGRAAEALAIVQNLRLLPEPVRDDPRIDLAEAAAGAATGDFKLQAEAAKRAVQKGQVRGARLLVADARVAECWANRNLGQPNEAAHACQDARDLYREAGDRLGVATALNNLASVRFDQGDLAGAKALYDETLATYREIGDKGSIALALNNLAVILRSQGDLQAARGLYEEALAACQETGNRLGEASALNNIGGLLSTQGDLDGAKERLERALALRREMADQSGAAYALHNLASVFRKRGDLDQARKGYDEALAIRRQIGQKIGEVVSLNGLAKVLLDQGDVGGARKASTEALALARETGNRSAEAAALAGLGEAALAAGDLGAADSQHVAALKIRQELGEKGMVADSKLAMAVVAAERADTAGAASLAKAAADQYASEQALDAQAMALVQLARAELVHGDARVVREAVDTAASLLSRSENRGVAFALALAEGRCLAAEGRAADAVGKLRALAGEMATAGYEPLALETELVLARMELARGNVAAGRGLLTHVVSAGKAKGLGLLAGKAQGFLG